MKLSLYRFILIFTLVLSFADFTFAQTEREQGIELYQKGEYEKAVESLQKIVETDKKNRQAWLYLGMSFAKLKKQSKAAEAFQKADKLIPDKAKGDDKDLNITAKPAPGYTDEARQNQVQGTIKLAIEFGADGGMKYIFLFQGLPNGLSKNAIDAAKKIKFEPAIKDGKPVRAIGIVKYSFTIY